MAGTKGSGVIRGNGSRPKSPMASRFRNAYRLNHGRTGFEGDWDDFVLTLNRRLQEAVSLNEEHKGAPFYAPANVLKRAVYELVLGLEGSGMASKIDNLIDAIRVGHENGKRFGDQRVLRRLQKEAQSDTFYFILLGLEGVGIDTFSLSKSNVTRFAQQLNYARRHKVPPEFLIGFLMQTGKIGEVCRRARNPKRFEKWYLEFPKPGLADERP